MVPLSGSLALEFGEIIAGECAYVAPDQGPGDQDRASVVAPRHQLEERVGDVGLGEAPFDVVFDDAFLPMGPGDLHSVH